MAADFEAFQQRLENDLQPLLDETYGHVTIKRAHIDKLLEGSYDALTVTRDDFGLGVSLNAGALFDRFSNGERYEALLNDAEKSVESGFRNAPQFDVNMLLDYEAMKEHLSVELVNTKANAELLATIPHKEIEDLSAVYRVILNANEDGRATVLIKNDTMEHLGIDPEQLHKDAVLASEKAHPVSLRTMSEVMRDMIGDDFPLPAEGPNLYVATNTDKVMGASVLLYPTFLQEAAEQLGESFYVLPSSIHEVLLVPESNGQTYQDLENMVRAVNESEVATQDRLSDNVYHYDSEGKRFELASDYEARISQRDEVLYDDVSADSDRQTITVLLVEPNQYPKTIQMDTGLESLQQAVGGFIETVYPFADQAVIICNDEGKVLGMPLNRALRDENGEVYDVLAGSFLVAGLDEDSFGSLTPEQLAKYEEMFHQPEAFVKMGRSVMAIPIPDEAVEKMSRSKPMGKAHDQPVL